MEIMQFIGGGGEKKCSGAMVIDKLCNAIQTGYVDIEEAALSLVKVAETAWLKQMSAWILYGRLPSFGKEDFFVKEVDGDENTQVSLPSLFPQTIIPFWGYYLQSFGHSKLFPSLILLVPDAIHN